MRPYVLRDITGVARNSTARIRLPLGVTISSVVFQYERSIIGTGSKASLASDWTELRVMVNGDAIQRLRGREIVDFANAYYGQPLVVRGKKMLPKVLFDAPWANRPEFGAALALGTAMGVDTALIEIDIADTANTANCKLSAWAMVDSGRDAAGNAMGPGVLRRFRRYTPPAATAGLNEWAQLPLRGRLLTLHLYGEAARFDKVTLRAAGGDAAGVIVWEGSDDLIKVLAAQNVSRKRQLQTGAFSIDLAPDGDVFAGGLRLDNLAELRIEANAAPGGAYTVLAETLE